MTLQKLSVTLVLLFLTSHATAVTVCTMGELSRSVEVIYSQPGHPVPCEVVYEKPNEGGLQTLWRANNEVGYCEAKAEAFVEKLRNMGWQCEANTVQEPVVESEAPAEIRTEETKADG